MLLRNPVLQRVGSWKVTNKELLRCHTHRWTLSSVVLHLADPVQGSTASAIPSRRSVSTHTVILLASERSHRKALDVPRPTYTVTAHLLESHDFRVSQPHSANTRPTFFQISTMLTSWDKLKLPERTIRTFARRLHPSDVLATPRTFATTYAFNQHASDTEQNPYWRSLGPWKDVQADEFLNYGWQVSCLNNSPSTTILTFDVRKRIRSTGETSS